MRAVQRVKKRASRIAQFYGLSVHSRRRSLSIPYDSPSLRNSPFQVIDCWIVGGDDASFQTLRPSGSARTAQEKTTEHLPSHLHQLRTQVRGTSHSCCHVERSLSMCVRLRRIENAAEISELGCAHMQKMNLSLWIRG